MLKIVGIGEYCISSNKSDIIKTYALGSCVALTVYCAKKSTLAMAHIALPDTVVNVNKKEEAKLVYFADQGVPLLLDFFLKDLKCTKDEINIMLYGGSNSRYEYDVFNIGRKNLSKIAGILNFYDLEYDCSNTGGLFSRTVEVRVSDGAYKIDSYPIKI